MKKLIAIATAITVAIMVSMAFAIPADAEAAYTLDTVIVGIELEPDCIKLECLDSNGELWEFYDEDEWHIGDIATLRLFGIDNDYTHDEIVGAEYNGSLELHELALYILEVTEK